MGEAEYIYFICLKFPAQRFTHLAPFTASEDVEARSFLRYVHRRTSRWAYCHDVWTLTSARRPAKTSVLSAPERKASATRVQDSTVLFPDSCARAATSPGATAPGASLSTATSSPMKTSSRSTPAPVSFPWPTLDPTPTEASSSFAPPRPRGWMASTSFSEG